MLSVHTYKMLFAVLYCSSNTYEMLSPNCLCRVSSFWLSITVSGLQRWPLPQRTVAGWYLRSSFIRIYMACCQVSHTTRQHLLLDLTRHLRKMHLLVLVCCSVLTCHSHYVV